MAHYHGKALLTALHDAGLCPDNARSIELHMPVDSAAFIRYEVLVAVEDLPRIARALLSLAPKPSDGDT